MAFYPYPDYRNPEIQADTRYLKQSRQDRWRRKYASINPMFARYPNWKAIEYSQCKDCPEYSGCKKPPCKKAKQSNGASGPDLWQKGDCQFCLSASCVVWVKKLAKRVCEDCGRDLKGQMIEKEPPPKTRKSYTRPSAINDLKILKVSHREALAKRYGDFKIRIPVEPKRKKIKFSQCSVCREYLRCKELCKKARQYANHDFVSPYPVLASTVPELEGSLEEFFANPESAPNAPIDNIFLFTTDIQETAHLFIVDNFEDPEVAEVYKAHLIDSFNKIKRMQSRTPPWAWRYSKALWSLYLYFERRLGIREIGRRVGLSHVRVLELVNLHRRVLENHLDQVVGAGARKSYFYERYFNRLTATQVAEKYGVTQPTVSKSIQRTKRRLKVSLRNAAISGQRMKREFSFSQDGKNIFIFFLHCIFLYAKSLT
jgi:hypothetical protein